jgi:hypothetical protein
MCENTFNFFPFIFLGELVVLEVVVVVEPFEAGVGDVFADISDEFSMTFMCV